MVLEEVQFEGDETRYYHKVHRVEGRNKTNALRRAFRELREGGFASETATLAVVPESLWVPKEVGAQPREQIVIG